jgi:hypothetical protein
METDHLEDLSVDGRTFQLWIHNSHLNTIHSLHKSHYHFYEHFMHSGVMK